ncbi:hypothetical protein EHI42_32360 [Rhizobium hidalgonense]|uniref:hypothetical protein n=1 Tax=Rhizobium hidalgonense TaxID=1538159 RepID=UPI000FEC738B|nr:hypothetical protein [Rhizobium hidalgonense]RWX05744.1 hypothetical protein EHI42_32360 [Rhizobium hidalgonense]
MVFGRFFGGGGGNDNKKEEQRLFELGMKSAVEFRSNEALDYYAKSIEVSENPSPYINRANLIGKRIRHFEAMQDLLRAQKIDLAQGKQFQGVIARELARNQVLTSNYTNGVAQKLVGDLHNKGASFVADRIVCTSFGIPQIHWDHWRGVTPLLEFHLFNDLDNIVKFDDINRYPEAKELVGRYPAAFIEMKVENCPDQRAYEDAEMSLHNFLCSYPEDDMIQIRRHMHYEIHKRLLVRDFGEMFDALDSDCEGAIKEAEGYLS